MCSWGKKKCWIWRNLSQKSFFVGERSSHCAGYIQEPSASDEEVVYKRCPLVIPAKPLSLSVLMENRAAATRWPDSQVQRHRWRPHHWRSRGQSGGCQSETPQIPWTPAALWRRLSDRTGWGPEKHLPLTAQLPYMRQSGWKISIESVETLHLNM